LFNNSYTESKKIAFDQSRLNSIVNKASDYKLAVKSLSGKFYIPFFNLKDYLFEVRMKFNSDSLDAIEQIPPLNIEIYTVEQFLNYLNNAMVACFNQIKNQYNAIYGANSWQTTPGLPQLNFNMTFNPDTQLFSLYSDELNNKNNSAKVDLLFDFSLYNLFTGLYYEIEDFIFTKIIFEKGFEDQNVKSLNGNSYIEMKQDTPSLGLWSDVSNIIITSNILSNRYEELLISSPGIEATTNNTTTIIANYPIFKENLYKRIILFDMPEMGYIDLLGENPLTRIQFEISYIKFNGEINNLIIGPRSSIFLKLILSKTFFVS
jgi:hypothetical protein